MTICSVPSTLALWAQSPRYDPASALALDCEGKDLGVEGGTLSLISLRVLEPGTSRIYLVDTISLTKAQLNSVFDIIKILSYQKYL